MNAVLISIRPEWCKKIITGKKTIELRKKRPNLAPPFKCYIYCTKGIQYRALAILPNGAARMVTCSNWRTAIPCGCYIGNGKVIGEFICDSIIRSEYEYDDDDPHYNPGPAALYWPYIDLEAACLSHAAVMDYGKKKPLYSWHISNLKIYEKPLEIWAFGRVCDTKQDCGCWEIGADGCHMDGDPCEVAIMRAPQSWCYVKEIKKAVPAAIGTARK